MECYDEYARKARLMVSIHAARAVGGGGGGAGAAGGVGGGGGEGGAAGGESAGAAPSVVLSSGKTNLQGPGEVGAGAPVAAAGLADKRKAGADEGGAGAAPKDAEKKKKTLKRL
jgi:hypothetical protein